MEDGLVLISLISLLFLILGLNPCCNGRWSRTYFNNRRKTMVKEVLILVVMEDGLVQKWKWK